jgi:hypothetical protein
MPRGYTATSARKLAKMITVIIARTLLFLNLAGWLFTEQHLKIIEKKILFKDFSSIALLSLSGGDYVDLYDY